MEACKTTDEFECYNGACISGFLTCNGQDDCGDNSDEEEICGQNNISAYLPR